MAQTKLTKDEIIEHALSLGAEFASLVSIDKWEESGYVPVELYPHQIWPQTRSVIVLGVPLAIEEVGRDQSKVTRDLLDQVAYRLAVFLNRKGYPSLNIPCDSEGKGIVEHKRVPVFSHIWAGYYGGILQQKSDLQLSLASVLTAFEFKDDPLS